VLTMTLNEITNQLLNIANEIENNAMFDNRLGAQKKRAAADCLIEELKKPTKDLKDYLKSLG